MRTATIAPAICAPLELELFLSPPPCPPLSPLSYPPPLPSSELLLPPWLLWMRKKSVGGGTGRGRERELTHCILSLCSEVVVVVSVPCPYVVLKLHLCKQTYIYTCTMYIHTLMHTYKQTYIQSYVNTCHLFLVNYMYEGWIIGTT